MVSAVGWRMSSRSESQRKKPICTSAKVEDKVEFRICVLAHVPKSCSGVLIYCDMLPFRHRSKGGLYGHQQYEKKKPQTLALFM